jgi:hypothetical protein
VRRQLSEISGGADSIAEGVRSIISVRSFSTARRSAVMPANGNHRELPNYLLMEQSQ